ncbi:MAG: hypothetical protein WKF71_04390 [Pyrinomonadaceae bacterium]
MKRSKKPIHLTVCLEQFACTNRASRKTGESDEEKIYEYYFNLRVFSSARLRTRFVFKARQLFRQNQPKNFYQRDERHVSNERRRGFFCAFDGRERRCAVGQSHKSERSGFYEK